MKQNLWFPLQPIRFDVFQLIPICFTRSGRNLESDEVVVNRNVSLWTVTSEAPQIADKLTRMEWEFLQVPEGKAIGTSDQGGIKFRVDYAKDKRPP